LPEVIMVNLKRHRLSPLLGAGIVAAVALCVVIFLGTGGVTAAAAAAAGPDDVTQLRADVAKLNERVAALEKELAALKARTPAGTITLVPTPAVPVPAQPVQGGGGLKMPEGSVEREFNGIRYFVVPLDRQPSPAGTAPIGEPQH
jgi:hypothetical protein